MNYFITINETEYELKFGMGFMRKIDKQVQMPIPNAGGIKQDAGLRLKIGQLLDGSLDAVEDILLVANEGKSPRLTRAILDAYIEDESTDVDGFVDEVLGFLRVANVSKRLVKEIEEAAQQQQ